MGSLQTWEETVSQKRAIRDQLIAPYLADVAQRLPRVQNAEERTRLEDPLIQTITDIDNVTTLLECMEKGEFLVEQVIRAYIQRAVVAHQLTNSLTEVLFEDALEQAKQLDAEFAETGKLKGPLHGIPITLKDQFNVKGVDTTLGYVGRSFPRPGRRSACADLEEHGCHRHCEDKYSTEYHGSSEWAETENPLWGLTTNPRNPLFSPGGSTGGEGALLTLHGSLLGFGTDIGGSVRIPQATVGLYGFKPSSARLPYQGVPVSTEGQEHVPSSIGPMARDLSSICYMSRLIANSRPWDVDPGCAPLPWNDTAFQELQDRPMVIGLILDDAALKAHGHEVVVWDTSDHAECIEIMDLFYTVDGGEDIRRDVAAAGEPFIPHVEALVNRGKAISVYEYWQLNKQKTAVQKKYLDKWNAARSPSGRAVDVLLSPTLPHTTVPHRKFRWVGYTKIWNLLDYPALTFPVDRVRAEVDVLPSEPYIPRNSLDEWNWNLFDAKQADGYPVNLQIIGKKLHEEKVLGAATVIEKLWKSHVDKSN
ncbi:hypothetical protein N7519_007677 [Penicillium mononematosum]|uniref:uncharacterized protein n=1 Tax=Penicillium mononematosum TaxID=268346 RepID=UPI002549107B|nr:uncharacterized protein N7519_007677 [Penicillium mononematosum]KAJ6186376.1 hypothetical protein N7519_007677 [Penicillium mononematosum]